MKIIDISFALMPLLLILLVALKLTGYIAWSWAWVLSPVWIVAALGLCFVWITLSDDALNTKHKKWWVD